MKVWIVGIMRAHSEAGVSWEFGGVFSSEKAAVDACRDGSYFVGPATMDEATPEQTEAWPGCYYPCAA